MGRRHKSESKLISGVIDFIRDDCEEIVFLIVVECLEIVLLLEISDIDLDEVLEEFIEKQSIKSLVNVNQPFGGIFSGRI